MEHWPDAPILGKFWILPLAVMGTLAFALGSLFSVTDASVVARYVVLVLFAIPCAAYIAYQVAREEHSEPVRRALRRAREARNSGSR